MKEWKRERERVGFPCFCFKCCQMVVKVRGGKRTLSIMINDHVLEDDDHDDDDQLPSQVGQAMD